MNGWALPFLVDDTVPGVSATLMSVRHARDDAMPITVDLRYFDPVFGPMATETVVLMPNELVSRNLRAIPELVTPGGVTRGFLTVIPDGPVTVDVFQVDDVGDFAVGGPAVPQTGFCFDWQARFLRFGPAGTDGTQLVVLIDGPLGGDLGDPPTLTGSIYSESGTLINSFTVRTDQWVVQLDVLTDLVIAGGPAFGTMRIDVSTEFSGAAFFTRHTAFGQFSVGSLAVCRSPI